MDLTTETRKVKGLAKSRAEACSKLTRKKGAFERERKKDDRLTGTLLISFCKDDA